MIRAAVLGAVVSLGVSVGAAAGPAGPAFQGDPQAVAEVQAAFQKFAAVPTWRARITSPARGGAQTIEYVAPDRMHMILPAQGSMQDEMFMIGANAWMRTGGGCQKLPVGMPMTNPREVMEHHSDAKLTVAKAGPTTIDGTPTLTYLMTVDSAGQQIKERLFVAAGTGLPRRVEIQSNHGPTVIDYFDYGAPVTINNPPC